jgi:hypothetical protein
MSNTCRAGGYQMAALERSGRWTGSGFRPYRPGAEDAGLLAVYNRAFHWHADQGGWDIDDLTGRTSSDWFRPEDLLVHDADDGSGRAADPGPARLCPLCDGTGEMPPSSSSPPFQ